MPAYKYALESKAETLILLSRAAGSLPTHTRNFLSFDILLSVAAAIISCLPQTHPQHKQ